MSQGDFACLHFSNSLTQAIILLNQASSQFRTLVIRFSVYIMYIPGPVILLHFFFVLSSRLSSSNEMHDFFTETRTRSRFVMK